MSSQAAIERLAGLVARSSSVLFITGAGISADSGLPTYRGVGGLYDGTTTDDGLPIEVALSGPMLRARPALTWKHVLDIDRACRGAEPNLAHRVIAALESRLRVHVLTQNVDGFHTRAGSSSVIEIHGSRGAVHCMSCSWRATVTDYAAFEAAELPPRCPSCGGVIRPAIVLFDEMLPEPAIAQLRRVLEAGVDLVVSVGTSSGFPYIRGPVEQAIAQGIPTVEINPGRTDLSDRVALKVAERAAVAFERLASHLGTAEG